MNRRKLFSILIALSLILITIPITVEAPLDEWVTSEVDEDLFWAANRFDGVDMVYLQGEDMQIWGWYLFEGPDVLEWGKPISEAYLSIRIMGDNQADPDASMTLYGQPARKGGAQSLYDEPDQINGPYTANQVNVNLSSFVGSGTWYNITVTNIIREINQGYYFYDGHSVAFVTLSPDGHDTERYVSSEESGYAAKLYVHYKTPDPEDPDYPPDLPDDTEWIEDYRNYTIWRRNGTITDWGYFKNITIEGPAIEQTDYQVKVVVHRGEGVDAGEDVYVGNNARGDFQDIRFYANDSITLLEFWSETLPIYGERIIDNDGYARAATQAIIHPMAIHYEGTYNRTYIVYMDKEFDPNILYYDHDDENFSNPVQITTSPLNDVHVAPSLLIDAYGYLHIFYGCHNTALKHAKSDNPEDITAWTVQGNPDAEATYPISRLTDNGTIFLFFRGRQVGGGRVENMLISTDNGTTWGARKDIVDLGADSVYHGNVILGDETPTQYIHMIFNVLDTPLQERDNVYYAYSPDWGVTWYSIDDTNLGATISRAEADANCLVYDSTGDPQIEYGGGATTAGNAMDIRLDASNDPFILFSSGKADNEMLFRFAKYNGGWNVDNIIPTKNGLNWGTLDYVDSTDIRAYLIVGGGPSEDRKGNLEYWGSNDTGETWTLRDTIADNNNSNNPKMVFNYDEDLQIIWNTPSSIPSDIYAYGDAMNGENVFWVEVDYLPASPNNNTIYMFYGNPEALTRSDGKETFPFFDNFTYVGDPTGQGWTEILAFGTYSYEAIGGELEMDTSGAIGSHRVSLTDNNTMNNSAIDYKMRIVTQYKETVFSETQNTGIRYCNETHFYQTALGNPSFDGKTRYALDWNLIYDLSFRAALNTQYDIVSVRAHSTRLETVIDDVLEGNGTDGNLTTGYGVIGVNAVKAYFDDYRVRKYAYPEPIIGDWGEEENETIETWYITDENGTIVWEGDNGYDTDDIEDLIDDDIIGYPDPEDPEPSGWEDAEFLTIHRFKLVLFLIGMIMFVGTPVYGFASRPEAATWITIFMCMIVGVALLWSLQTM